MNTADIEQQIREVLATEHNCWSLSDKLFGPQGLFGKLGPTFEDRLRVGRSPLFKEAQKKLRELQRLQAQVFRDDMARFRGRLRQAKQA